MVSRSSRPASLSTVQKEIGARIRWARELVVPNRAAFARAIGVDRTTVQKIEDGDRPPSVFNVLDFAYRLRVSTDYILRGSMLGVDAELADLLLKAHPELRAAPVHRTRPDEDIERRVQEDGKPPKPMRPGAGA